MNTANRDAPIAGGHPLFSSAALLSRTLFGQCADRFRNRLEPLKRNGQAADVGQSVGTFFNFRKSPLNTSKTHDVMSHELSIELERAELLSVILELLGTTPALRVDTDFVRLAVLCSRSKGSPQLAQ